MDYLVYAKLRDSKGYTDYRVAKEIGTTPSTFSDWKSGRCTPKIEKLKKILHCLDVSDEDVYFYIEGTHNSGFNERMAAYVSNIYSKKILDAYNAAPDSIKEAVNKLLDIPKD